MRPKRRNSGRSPSGFRRIHPTIVKHAPILLPLGIAAHDTVVYSIGPFALGSIAFAKCSVATRALSGPRLVSRNQPVNASSEFADFSHTAATHCQANPFAKPIVAIASIVYAIAGVIMRMPRGAKSARTQPMFFRDFQLTPLSVCEL